MSGEESKPRVIIRKKKGGHGGAHGGAWKVAYADFVTAMMALFMVLWLLTQADLKLRSQIAQYFRDPGILAGGSVINPEQTPAKSRDPEVVTKDIIVVQGKAKSEQELLEGTRQELQEAIKAAAKENPELAQIEDQVIIQVTDAGLSIQVLDAKKSKDLLFDLSSAELKPPLVDLLRRIAGLLAKLPNHVQVGGHTDSRPYPTASKKTNWELSFERANNARRVLQDAGLRPGQINKVLAYADSQPLVPENPMADENRRLSILAEREASPPEKDAKDGETPLVLPPDALPEKPAAAAS
jgi:chemotaxis protein MotB